MNTGKTLFAQLMEFVPWTTVYRSAYDLRGTLDNSGWLSGADAVRPRRPTPVGVYRRQG